MGGPQSSPGVAGPPPTCQPNSASDWPAPEAWFSTATEFLGSMTLSVTNALWPLPPALRALQPGSMLDLKSSSLATWASGLPEGHSLRRNRSAFKPEKKEMLEAESSRAFTASFWLKQKPVLWRRQGKH